ncbi:hypothetical protein SUDANB121_03572 [Nocardiopsis dassonvillei]|uniref:hypothetical protein n=1 Tax=Nocardiopsis dassonvillei TaxID=2014 RepID=UPI003F57F047
MNGSRSGASLVEGFHSLEVLRRSANATVYRAVPDGGGDPVVLKVVRAVGGGPARPEVPDGVPGLVPVLARGSTRSGRPFAAMPLYAEGDYAGLLDRRHPLPLPEVARVGAVAAGALGVLHAAGLAHHGVEPAHLLSGGGEVALAGLDRVRPLGDPGPAPDVATLPYTPPEVVGGGAAAPASDVYRLAAALWALLAGRAPFGDGPGDLFALRERVLGSVLPPPREDLPGAWRAVLSRALEKDPALRHPDAAAFAADLASAQAGTPAERASAGTAPAGRAWPAAPVPGPEAEAETSVDAAAPPAPAGPAVTPGPPLPESAGHPWDTGSTPETRAPARTPAGSPAPPPDAPAADSVGEASAADAVGEASEGTAPTPPAVDEEAPGEPPAPRPASREPAAHPTASRPPVPGAAGRAQGTGTASAEAQDGLPAPQPRTPTRPAPATPPTAPAEGAHAEAVGAPRPPAPATPDLPQAAGAASAETAGTPAGPGTAEPPATARAPLTVPGGSAPTDPWHGIADRAAPSAHAIPGRAAPPPSAPRRDGGGPGDPWHGIAGAAPPSPKANTAPRTRPEPDDTTGDAWHGPVDRRTPGGPHDREDGSAPRWGAVRTAVVAAAVLVTVLGVATFLNPGPVASVLGAVGLMSREEPPAPEGGLPEVSDVPTAAVAPEAAPGGVALEDSGDAVVLTWTAAEGAGSAPHHVVGGPVGDTPASLADAPAGTSEVRVEGLDPGTEYCFIVIALLGGDTIAHSEEVCTDRGAG